MYHLASSVGKRSTSLYIVLSSKLKNTSQLVHIICLRSTLNLYNIITYIWYRHALKSLPKKYIYIPTVSAQQRFLLHYYQITLSLRKNFYLSFYKYSIIYTMHIYSCRNLKIRVNYWYERERERLFYIF